MPKITTYIELVDRMSARFAKIEAATRKATAAADQLKASHATMGVSAADGLNAKLSIQEAMLERQGQIAADLESKYEGLASTAGLQAEKTQQVHDQLLRAQLAEVSLQEAANRTAAQIDKQAQSARQAAEALERSKMMQEETIAKASVMGREYSAAVNNISSELARFSSYAQGMDLEIFKPQEIEKYSATLNSVQSSLNNTYRAQAVLSDAMDIGEVSQINAAMKNYDSSVQKLIASNQRAATATETLKACEWQRVEALEATKRAQADAYAQGAYEKTKKQIIEMQAAHKGVTGCVNDSTQAQREYSEAVNKSSNGAQNLWNKVKGLAGAYLGMAALKNGIDATDTYTSNAARLGMVNDGLQTQAQLQNNIYEAAQRSRTGYNDMVDSVAKLNMLAKNSFASNNEAIQFTELMNKAFKVSGASAQQSKSAMQQLTQAMAAGRLQGDEFTSIMENAPMVAQAIADYTGVGMEGLKKMSSQGELTADVVKNALFSAGGDIEAQFSKLPMTFAEAGVILQNEATKAFEGVMEKANELLNSETGQAIMRGIMVGIDLVASVMSEAMDLISSAGDYIRENWETIGPILQYVGVCAAILAAGFLVYSVASGIATAAQALFNATLLGCPIVWIIIAIAGLIAIIYGAVNAFNDLTGSTVSATGVIFGLLAGLAAHVYNVFSFSYNIVASIVEFIVNAFTDLNYSGKKLFGNLATNVLEMLISMTKGFDELATNIANSFVWGINKAIDAVNWLGEMVGKIPGMDGWSLDHLSTTDSFTGTLESLKTNINKWVGEEPDDYWSAPKLEKIALDDAFNKGYQFGENIDSMFAGSKDKKGNKSAAQTYDENYSLDSPALDGIGKDTKKISDSVESAEEDMKWLKDIAEQEIINRFTTATLAPKLTVEIANVNKNADLDGITQNLEEELRELIAISAEGC